MASSPVRFLTKCSHDVLSDNGNFVKNLYIAPEIEQLENLTHRLATACDLVTNNIFLQALFSTKFSDLLCDLFIGQASSL